MTDTTAAPPSPWFDVVKAAIPYVGQALVLIVTFGVGYLTNAYVNKPHLAIEAADKPRPVPVVSLSDVDHSLQTYCGEVKTLLLERLPAQKKPSR